MGQFSSHLRVDPKLLKVAKERAIHATSQALLFNYHVLGGSKGDQSDRSSSTATTQVGAGEGDDSNYSQPEFSVKLELEKTTSKKWEKRLKALNFSKDLVNSGTGFLPHSKQWNMSLLDLLGLGPIFH